MAGALKANITTRPEVAPTSNTKTKEHTKDKGVKDKGVKSLI